MIIDTKRLHRSTKFADRNQNLTTKLISKNVSVILIISFFAHKLKNERDLNINYNLGLPTRRTPTQTEARSFSMEIKKAFCVQKNMLKNASLSNIIWCFKCKAKKFYLKSLGAGGLSYRRL